MKHRLFWGIVFFISIPLLSACGRSGGDETPPPANLAPTVLTKSAAHTAITALSLAQEGITIDAMPLPSWLGSERIVTRFKSETPELNLITQLHNEVQKFKSVPPNQSAKTFNTVTPIPFEQACGTGTTDDADTPQDSTDDSFSISLSCNPGLNPGGGGVAFGQFSAGPTRDTNGNIIRHPDGSVVQYRFAYNNYTLTNFFVVQQNQNGPLTNLVSTHSNSRNGTILLDVAPGNCFRRTIFENTAGTFNLSGVQRRDNDGDGFFEIDQEFALSNLVVSIAETELCAAGPITITINGTSSFTDNADPSKSVSSTFNNVVITVTPASKAINTKETLGHDFTQNGEISVSSANNCLNGTFGLSTETPFFVPLNQACAILGKHLMTDTTGLETAVLATVSGGIEVDKGNDGTIEQIFSDCREAEICSP